MESIMECRKALSEFGVELENGMRTLRITARCVPQEDKDQADSLKSFVLGLGYSQKYYGSWARPAGLLGALRRYGYRAEADYVADPAYREAEYVERQEEPLCNLDPVSIAMNVDIDMEEPEYLPDPERWKTSRVMGISFGFAAVREVVVDEDNPYFASRDGVLFSKDMTRLIWYPYGKQDRIYTVPDSVTEIGPWAFAGYPHELPVKREDGSIVQDRGNNKYHVKYVYNKSLRQVVLPDTVTVIREEAFNHCLFLASIDLSSKLKEIRWDAFRGCKELWSIWLPDSLEYMEPAFEGCHKLKKVRFLGTRHQITRTWKTRSSSKCTTYMGPVPYSPDYMAELFHRTSDKEEPEILFDSPWFTITDGVMFNRDRTELIWCDRWKKGSYTVPSTVVRIGERAFADCENLTQISISHPGTVIEKRAFFCCRKLEQVVFQGSGSVKSIGDHAFQGCEKLRNIELAEAESIGECAFYACRWLGPEVRVSKDCRHIGKQAFDLCENLRSLYVPKALANFRYESLDSKRKRCLKLPYGYAD